MTARPDPVLLDNGRQVDVVEEITSSAPMGVRFWDWALARPVKDGLVVRARPAAGGPVTTARASSSGVYGFLSLPTTRMAELGPVEDFADPHDYLLAVTDAYGRYVSMGLTLQAPVAGVQPAPGSLPDVGGVSPALPGYYLFASASRPLPPGYLALRLDLSDETRPVDGAVDTFAPAAHALVAVAVAGATWYGVADDDGRALVLAPAPTFSSPTDGDGPLDPHDQSWPANVEVRYDALAATGFPGTPDFADIADQAVATAKFAATFTTSLTVDIEYGEALVVRSPGRSDLLVRPA